MIKYFFTIFLTIILGSCKMGPDFVSLKSKINQETLFINADNKVSFNSSMNKWWEDFEDPLLNKYVEQMLDENLELKEAAQRIVQARQKLAISRGEYFPSISNDLSASRGFAPSSNTNQRVYSSTYAGDVDVSWQIDLFGKIRRGVESRKATFKATIYDREALAHLLIADLVESRINISVYAKLLNFAQESMESQKKIYELQKKRYENGANQTLLSDVLLAKDGYNSLKADVGFYERTLAAEIYFIDSLLGQKPGTTKPLESDFPMLELQEVPICLPASLLDRRPDLRAASLRQKAANADIGVAIADLYPSLSITGSVGVQSDISDGILSSSQLTSSILGGVTTKIFQGGALRANIKLQKSEAEELAINYSNQVLTALREVETALKNDKELKKEVEYKKSSTDALQKAEKISNSRYNRGVESLKDLLEVKKLRYQVEKSHLNKIQENLSNRISLYLALGGDWVNDKKDEDKINYCVNIKTKSKKQLKND